MSVPIFKFNKNSLSAIVLDSTQSGASVDVSDSNVLFAQLVWSGGSSLDGTFSIQLSSDNSTFNDAAAAVATSGVSGSVYMNVASAGAPYARITFTSVGGTATLANGYFCGKQV